MPKLNSKAQWLGSVTAKVIGITTLVAASAGLVNGDIDLYNASLRLPTNKYEKINHELFKKNFGKQPLVSQPISIKQSNLTVEMLLQVFDSGDIFVRYGESQQWLPFTPLKMSSRSMLSEAFAQTSLPLPKQSKENTSNYGAKIIIDVDQLKRKIGEDSGLLNSTPQILEKSYVLAKLKDDHPSYSVSLAELTQKPLPQSRATRS